MEPQVTRRQIGWILGLFGAASAQAQTQKSGTVIHQEIDYEVKPARLYKVLLDAKEFSAFSKSAAEVQARPGAAFKLFGGQIEGRNVELVSNQRIVQAWRPASWAPGVYSMVRFELTARGAGVRIVLDHAGFPKEHFEHLSSGWTSNYWEPLHQYLNA